MNARCDFAAFVYKLLTLKRCNAIANNTALHLFVKDLHRVRIYTSTKKIFLRHSERSGVQKLVYYIMKFK